MKKVKLDYHVKIGDKGHFYNEAVPTLTKEKTATAEVEIFDNGTEGQFLVFKSDDFKKHIKNMFNKFSS